MGKAGTKIRDQNFEDSEKALESEFRLFPTITNIDGYMYQWCSLKTSYNHYKTVYDKKKYLT